MLTLQFTKEKGLLQVKNAAQRKSSYRLRWEKAPLLRMLLGSFCAAYVLRLHYCASSLNSPQAQP